jgi:hypothetical protein
MLKRMMMSLAVVAPTLLAGTAVVTPAEAHYTGYPHNHYNTYRPRPPRCWYETQRHRVWGPYGPRWVSRQVRICR